MNTHRFLLASVVGAVLLSPRVGSAEETMFIAGIQAQLVTAATVTVGDGTVDGNTTGALAADVEVEVSPYVSFGFAPRLVFEAGPASGPVDQGAQIDLVGRLTGRVPVTRTLAPFAYLAAGYSLVGVPDGGEPGGDAEGAVLGLGGGAALQVSPEIAVLIDVGYQVGFHRLTDAQGDLIADADYGLHDLHIGVGVQTRL